jgi:hypothetical protein
LRVGHLHWNTRPSNNLQRLSQVPIVRRLIQGGGPDSPQGSFTREEAAYVNVLQSTI